MHVVEDSTVIEKIKTYFHLPPGCRFSVERQSRSQSTLWQVKVSEGSEATSFFVKTIGKNAENQAFLVKRAAENLADCPFYTPQSVFYDPELELMISREFLGRSIESILSRPPYLRLDLWFRELCAAMHYAGSWLNLYHRSHQYGSVSEPLKRYLNNRENDLRELPRDDRNALIGLLNTDIRDELVITHGDFTPGNVLIHGSAICVIDFGVREWIEMSPSWDVLTLLVALDRYSLFNLKCPLYWLRSLSRQLKHEFLKCYGAGVTQSARTVQACAAVRHFSFIFASGNGALRQGDARAQWHLRELHRILR